MLIHNAKVRLSPGRGIGLFATEDIPTGTVIWCPCDKCEYYEKGVLGHCSDEMAFRLEEHGYYLVNGDILIPCQNACYMNHSCEANCLDFGLDFGLAVKPIKKDEEIFCDYRNWQNDPDWEFNCCCGTARCQKKISPRHGEARDLQQEWMRKLNGGLKQMASVRQGLFETLIRCSHHFPRLIRNIGLFDHKTAVTVRAPHFIKEGDKL